MKKALLSTICLMVLLLAAGAAFAKDNKVTLPIAAALEAKDAQEKLQGGVKFFFGSQEHPKVLKTFSTDTANRKTNALGRTEAAACNWAFLSAMIALQQRAVQLGANAVVNIVSFNLDVEMSSPTEFECHAGTIMSGVALKGDFVTIADK